jgi:ferritin-like metal-binding protein YciE
VERLEKVFALCDTKAIGKTCQGIKGILEEGEEDMKEAADPDVLHADMIADAQAVEHYEIETLATHGHRLGQLAWDKKLPLPSATSSKVGMLWTARVFPAPFCVLP